MKKQRKKELTGSDEDKCQMLEARDVIELCKRKEP